MLTDEERRKIYEEEKARLEAQEELKRKATPKHVGLDYRWLSFGGGLVLLIIVCSLCVKKPAETPTPAGSSSPGGSPASYAPQLELLSWNWGKTSGGGYVEVKGQVKNISSQSLKNVTAVVTFYTKDKVFITSSDALIDYNPIMPGQTSPFSVLETDNPAMRSATVEFKHLMGGTIRHREK